MARYYRPTSVDDALAALAERGWLILAGGTDIYPARVGKPLDDDVLDISGLNDLRGIEEDAAGWRIGALTRWSDILRTPLPPLFDGLKLAAREVGGRQIQNAGTLVGNICNASPAADGTPNLMALNAVAELASSRNYRLVPMSEFVLGNRRTARRPDELVTAIHVPRPSGDAHSHFLKLGARRYLVISVTMAAFSVELQGGRISRAGIAVGACAPTAKRLPELERRLIGRPLDRDLPALADPACLAPLRPINDIRASADYRLDACLTLLRRGLADLSAHVLEAA